MEYKPRKLDDCHNIDDLRELARHRLPSPVFHYLDGAAETELTARRNTTAFDELNLLTHCLVDVSSVATRVSVMGETIDWPVICSPTGASRLFHAEGELAVARAAADAGIYYCLSTMSTFSIEQVARASAGPKMFQLYIFRDRGLTREMAEQCRAFGYRALCVTVDTAVPGNRERDFRTGMGVPPRLSFSSMSSFLRHPGWLAGLARSGPLCMPGVVARTGSKSMAAHARFFAEQLDPSVTWQDIREIIKGWDGPFAIKGILTAKDALRAVDAGATAIIVSNHGGRQLDGATAAIEALPAIVKAVGQQAEIILDGGIRRGSHVVKALACGATACSIGRPYLYGLGAGGETGVKKALHILRNEFERAMQLLGCNDVRELNTGYVEIRRPFER